MLLGNLFDVGQNLQFSICNLLILAFYVIYVILGLGYLFQCFYLFLMLFSQIRFCVFSKPP